MKKILIFSLLGLVSMTACMDLDIPPKNFVTDDALMSSESGMDIYMSQLYSHMPFEEFKYMPEWGLEYNSWLGALGVEGTGEAVCRDGYCTAFTGERTAYWGQAYELIRSANHLLTTFPSYKSHFSDVRYNHYLGEAYYVRATVFYAMARRYGGVPLVTTEIAYPVNEDVLTWPRATEEETWNQILADFDKAAELMEPTSPKSGYSNKYVALAFKSEAMLYAGCVAKYNEMFTDRLTGFGSKTGVRVIGFDETTAANASKKYFTEAYKAANEVIESTKYSLYKKKWNASDREAQYQNMVEMFSDLSSPENIYIKEYVYPTMTHGIDAYSAPFIFRSPLSAGTCPTLDFVELFEGFPRYPDGTIKLTTGNSNSEGTYVMYNTAQEFFANAEPRLRAYIIFPFDNFKGKEIDVRAGIYTGATPIAPLFTDYSYSTADKTYQGLTIYSGSPKTLYLSPNSENAQEKVTYNGSPMTAAGLNGPFYSNAEATVTGFYLRKWLNTDPSFIADEGKSDQHFVLMRYGEVMINAAEAAVELSLAGAATPDGSDMLQVATDAMNAIRERAGATLLAAKLQGTDAARNTVRKERRKELAFEGKTRWDLRRWRVQHIDNRDLFWGEQRDKTKFSSDSRYRFRGLYPFFSTVAGKYFFDSRFQWISQKTMEYNPVNYYFGIPGGEVSKSDYIDQQPNR